MPRRRPSHPYYRLLIQRVLSHNRRQDEAVDVCSKRGGVMAVFITAILMIVGLMTYPGAQVAGKFVGVDDDPWIGDAKAKVTIIEFGDYQCPSCRMFWRE